MSAETEHHSDQRAEPVPRRHPRAPRPVGTFLGAGEPPTDAASLAADLAALINAGLIRRARVGGERAFEVTEFGTSVNAEAK